MDNVSYNDGKGFLDNIGLIETLIVDCNDLPKTMLNGHYVAFCAKIVEMVQKLSRLKEGVNADTNELKIRIKELQAEKDKLESQICGSPVETVELTEMELENG